MTKYSLCEASFFSFFGPFFLFFWSLLPRKIKNSKGGDEKIYIQNLRTCIGFGDSTGDNSSRELLCLLRLLPFFLLSPLG